MLLAVGLTLSGSAYLAISFMSADASDILKSSNGTNRPSQRMNIER